MWRPVSAAALVLAAFSATAGGTSSDPVSGKSPLVVTGSADSEIFSFGRQVEVVGSARNVLVFGADVKVVGTVAEDVAAVGGTVIQSKGSFIGGDVLVLGGDYVNEAGSEGRTRSRETVVYAGYEKEIREMVLNPASALAPGLTWSFLAQRVLSVLFWFLVAAGVNTLIPSTVGSAISDLGANPLRIAAYGVGTLVAVSAGLSVLVGLIPGLVSTLLGLLVILGILVSYTFGRSVLQVTVGRYVQKRLPWVAGRTEMGALVVGSVIWTLVLSVPYAWTMAVLVLFSMSVGMTVTLGIRLMTPSQRPG